MDRAVERPSGRRARALSLRGRPLRAARHGLGEARIRRLDPARPVLRLRARGLDLSLGVGCPDPTRPPSTARSPPWVLASRSTRSARAIAMEPIGSRLEHPAGLEPARPPGPGPDGGFLDRGGAHPAATLSRRGGLRGGLDQRHRRWQPLRQREPPAVPAHRSCGPGPTPSSRRGSPSAACRPSRPGRSSRRRPSCARSAGDQGEGAFWVGATRSAGGWDCMALRALRVQPQRLAGRRRLRAPRRSRAAPVRDELPPRPLGRASPERVPDRRGSRAIA